MQLITDLLTSKNRCVIFTFIVLIAGFLRFWQLGTIPPSLTWDEAAWGYNAYSLGIDGKDEFGRFLPYEYIESFGDFKPPVYAYLAIIPVKIFGLNEFAVRFPSALLGTLTIVITFFLVKAIFLHGGKKFNTESVALLTSFFLAISPWHINLSRAAFEANVATFFIVTGVWLFLEGTKGKKWYLVISAASFVASLYTFNTARVVVPILVLIITIMLRKKLFKQKKQVFLAFLVGFLLVLPIMPFLLSPQAGLRFKEVNIFSDIEVIQRTNQEIQNDGNTVWSGVLHNRRFAYSVEYIKHYLDHFNPSFLFIRGDGNPKFSTQDVGQLYLWELPFVISGVFLLFRKRIGYWWLVPLWLVIGIIPAATARETPHALRIETVLPTFQILTALGVVFFLSRIRESSLKIGFRTTILFVALSLLLLNVAYYLHGYYTHYEREFSGEWQYGYRDSIDFVIEQKNSFDQIYVTTNLGRPYIYYLFYEKTSPEFFRRNSVVERDAFGFVTVKRFGKYMFSKDLHGVKQVSGNTLYVNVPSQVPGNAKILKTFTLLNGDIALIAYVL